MGSRRRPLVPFGPEQPGPLGLECTNHLIHDDDNDHHNDAAHAVTAHPRHFLARLTKEPDLLRNPLSWSPKVSVCSPTLPRRCAAASYPNTLPAVWRSVVPFNLARALVVIRRRFWRVRHDYAVQIRDLLPLSQSLAEQGAANAPCAHSQMAPVLAPLRKSGQLPWALALPRP